MKTLELKETKIPKIKVGEKQEESNEMLNYGDFIKTALNIVPEKGFTPEEMKKRFRILDALEKDSKTLELEDADVVTLKDCIKAMQWGVLHKDIITFCEEINKI